jgi:hypothetical protein
MAQHRGNKYIDFHFYKDGQRVNVNQEQNLNIYPNNPLRHIYSVGPIGRLKQIFRVSYTRNDRTSGWNKDDIVNVIRKMTKSRRSGNVVLPIIFLDKWTHIQQTAWAIGRVQNPMQEITFTRYVGHNIELSHDAHRYHYTVDINGSRFLVEFPYNDTTRIWGRPENWNCSPDNTNNGQMHSIRMYLTQLLTSTGERVKGHGQPRGVYIHHVDNLNIIGLNPNPVPPAQNSSQLIQIIAQILIAVLLSTTIQHFHIFS